MKIKRFIECLLPVTACNLKCSYCYVMQRNYRNMTLPKYKYDFETMKVGLDQSRWGGTCYFSICGAGETLLPKEIVELTKIFLENGHFVNLTTNGTLSSRFEEFSKLPKEYLARLNFSFSFHYLELLKKNLIDTFFVNVKKVKEFGSSFVVQINLCDEYLPYLDEIKELCIKNLGDMPQVAATRKETNLRNNIEIYSSLSKEEYLKIGQTFDSPLFDFTMKNFNLKQNDFCYAGDWTCVLNLENGILSRCYASHIHQDIFANPKKKINFCAIGKHCMSPFCMNSSHFLSLGAIPTKYSNITYGSLRNRQNSNWYNTTAYDFLNQKLSENNDTYGFLKKIKTNVYGCVDSSLDTAYRIKHKLTKK